MTFQEQLQSIQFRTFYNNQSKIFGYNEIFAGRKILIFSTPTPLPSIYQLESYNKNYQVLINLGIDQIYCTSADSQLVGPWADKNSDNIIGLADFTQKFVATLAEEYQITKPLSDLIQHWQYVVVLDDGIPTNFWHNPIKRDMSWKIIKNPKFRYHNLKANKIIEFLQKSIDTE